ncbi:ABC transporter permease [Nocardioides insulae]|uniref:ABC transporter permease n=1 Tax=Nocardioides insulae TaxID=394734 RepID=UPI0004134AF5|nr:ABC transporter permease [Nocardioides insulae]
MNRPAAVLNTTYAAIELRRVSRDLVSLFFIAGLPAVLYLIFGSSAEDSAVRVGDGNVAFYVMVSMAAYGAVTATTGVGGMAAVERMQGWGRQLGLTPMSDAGFVVVKTFVSFAIAVVPIALIYLLGGLTGAEADPSSWLISGLVVLAGAAVFSLYGLAVGLMFRSEGAVSAASGSLVILAFLGNVFFPLSGLMLDIARFTPLYGYVALARYPITGGELVSATGPTSETDPLWLPVLNLVVWAIIFAGLAVWLVRRGRGRQ